MSDYYKQKCAELERKLDRVAFLSGWYASNADCNGNRELSMLCVDLMDATAEVRDGEQHLEPRIASWEAMHR